MTTTLTHTPHICITRPGQEDFIAQEISLRGHADICSQLAPQVISLPSVHDAQIFAIPLCFARQILPSAIPIREQSVSQWAEKIVAHAISNERLLATGWKLHVFDPKTSETGEQYARARLVEERVMRILKARRRSLLRALESHDASCGTLVQVLCLSKEDGFISVTTDTHRALYRSCLSVHRAGYVHIRDDKNPPSRAFKKLQEAEKIFGLSFSKGETAVDLGASPGGWTYVLNEAGLHITALDRSPLDPSLMTKTSVNWLKDNALTWTPPAPVSWLVCDVITTPENTRKILTSWITNSLCEKFCVTVKCQGAPAFDTIKDILFFLKDHCSWFDAKQLTHNKNELTVCGHLGNNVTTSKRNH